LLKWKASQWLVQAIARKTMFAEVVNKASSLTLSDIGLNEFRDGLQYRD
jgi:hypothetical protein